MDEAALSLRFRDESTRTSALLDLGLSRSGKDWLRSRAVVRSSQFRTRGDLEVAGGLPVPRGSVSLGERFYFQGGPQGTGGVINQVSAAWQIRALPYGLNLQVKGSAEHSRSGEDSLASLFNYRVLRPSLDLRRPLGQAGDLVLRVGGAKKDTGGRAVGAYTGRWVEAEWIQWGSLDHAWNLRLRSEARGYGTGDTLTPSYDESELEADVELDGPWRLRTRFRPMARRIEYAVDSEIFRDHWAAEGMLRAEASWRELLGKEDLPDLAAGDWSVSLGGKAGLLQHETRSDSNYHTLSALAGVSRDATERVWLDWTCEAGRRTYRVSGGTKGLVFEGLNISLSGTDYTFFSSSVLAEAELWSGLKAEAFGMVDHEVHGESEDDFSLWSFTFSLTRSF